MVSVCVCECMMCVCEDMVSESVLSFAANAKIYWPLRSVNFVAENFHPRVCRSQGLANSGVFSSYFRFTPGVG